MGRGMQRRNRSAITALREGRQSRKMIAASRNESASEQWRLRYLTGFGAPVPDSQLRALELRLGLDENALPSGLIQNEFADLWNHRLRTRDGDGISAAIEEMTLESRGRTYYQGIRSLAALENVIREIREYGPTRAPWNEDARLYHASMAVAEQMVSRRGIDMPTAIAQIEQTTRRGFNAWPAILVEAPDVAALIGTTVGPEHQKMADGINRALLLGPTIGSRYIANRLMTRGAALTGRGATRGPTAGHEEIRERFSVPTVGLLATAMYAHGTNTDTFVQWLENPSDDLDGRTPLLVMERDPKGMWERVVASASKPPSQ